MIFQVAQKHVIITKVVLMIKKKITLRTIRILMMMVLSLRIVFLLMSNLLVNMTPVLFLFHSKNPDQICDRRLRIQEKQSEDIINRFDDENVAITDKVLLYKSITPNQQKNY